MSKRKFPKVPKRLTADERDLHFSAGMRSVYIELLHAVLSGLGWQVKDDDELAVVVKLARLVSEREQTVAKLRAMCADLGDNDWSSDLHLADVIDKHLWRHMETR